MKRTKDKDKPFYLTNPNTKKYLHYNWYKPVANAEVGDLVIHNPYLRPWHSVEDSILSHLYQHIQNELLANKTLPAAHRKYLKIALKDNTTKRKHIVYSGAQHNTPTERYLLELNNWANQHTSLHSIYKITSIYKGKLDDNDWRADVELVHGHMDGELVYTSIISSNAKNDEHHIAIPLPTTIKNIELSALRPLQLLSKEYKYQVMTDVHNNQFNLTLSNNAYERNNRDYPQTRNEVTYITFKNTDYKEIYTATQYDYKIGGIKGRKTLVLNDNNEYETVNTKKTTVIPFSEVELVRSRGFEHQEPFKLSDTTVQTLYPNTLPATVRDRIEKVEIVDVDSIISNAII